MLLAAGHVMASDKDTTSDVVVNDEMVTISSGKRPLAEYRYQGVPFKPYVAKLYTPNGVQILRDSPHDHKHHHALMFALSVDGVDFWSERPRCGSQKSQAIKELHNTHKGVQLQTGFVDKLVWTEPKKGKVLLNEQRSIDVELLEKPRPVTLLTWESQLSVPQGMDSVKLGGEHYFGLGMRFVESMDKGGRFFNSEKAPGQVVRGTERLTAARWCAYEAKVDDKPVTVVLFDFPANPRHPNKMFSMTRPFSYLSATLNLWKEPMTLKDAKPLSLCYGVVVCDGTLKPSEIDAVYQHWLAKQALRIADEMYK